ncbi:hypothetical protein PED39_02485 [Methanomassiliicoccales archaeon LGM-RCC1]|nr:hypothetical protein PED39_02485 [Methanomassiliicoccales archaeon LGM-RCC1]
MSLDLSNLETGELIEAYGDCIALLKERNVIRTNNVVGDLGEYLVMEQYKKDTTLPNLTPAATGTKNVDAIGRNGKMYSIKTTTGSVTGVIYGLHTPDENVPDEKMFDYLVICRLDRNYRLKAIYQLDWDAFVRHKKWHSRMRAWNVCVSKEVIADSRIVYESGEEDFNQTRLF